MRTAIYNAAEAWSDFDQRKLVTPPECGGQIVERSYGSDGTYIFEVIDDRSDQDGRIVRAYWSSGNDIFEPWNGTPNVSDSSYIGQIEGFAAWFVVSLEGETLSRRSSYVDAVWDADGIHNVLCLADAAELGAPWFPIGFNGGEK